MVVRLGFTPEGPASATTVEFAEAAVGALG